MIDLVGNKVHDETRQGEAFAPVPAGANEYRKTFYIESYGCQMNFSDSEIVASILQQQGFGATRDAASADLILLNTCSIREKAEQTVRKGAREAHGGLLLRLWYECLRHTGRATRRLQMLL